MATHSSILAWRIPLDRGAWRATVHRVAKSWECLRTHTHRYRKRYTNHNLWLNLMNYYKMKHFNVIIHIRNWTLFNIQYSRCLSYAPTHSPCPSFFLEVVMKKIQTLWSSLRRLRTWWAMSSACLLSVQNLLLKNKFNQRSEKKKKQRKAVKQQKKNSLVIKQSQGLLVPSQGL